MPLSRLSTLPLPASKAMKRKIATISSVTSSNKALATSLALVKSSPNCDLAAVHKAFAISVVSASKTSSNCLASSLKSPDKRLSQ